MRRTPSSCQRRQGLLRHRGEQHEFRVQHRRVACLAQRARAVQPTPQHGRQVDPDKSRAGSAAGGQLLLQEFRRDQRLLQLAKQLAKQLDTQRAAARLEPVHQRGGEFRGLWRVGQVVGRHRRDKPRDIGCRVALELPEQLDPDLARHRGDAVGILRLAAAREPDRETAILGAREDIVAIQAALDHGLAQHHQARGDIGPAPAKGLLQRLKLHQANASDHRFARHADVVGRLAVRVERDDAAPHGALLVDHRRGQLDLRLRAVLASHQQAHATGFTGLALGKPAAPRLSHTSLGDQAADVHAVQRSFWSGLL